MRIKSSVRLMPLLLALLWAPAPHAHAAKTGQKVGLFFSPHPLG